jgi:hypothetical protein
VIDLPENRDKKGKLTIYNDKGEQVCKKDGYEALGRGSNRKENDNNHTKWWKKNADTPTGKWNGKIIAPGTDTKKFGPNERISMEPVEGHAKEASGRSGFQIHGGAPEKNKKRSWYPLRPTLGCIRVSNEDMAEIIKKIKGLIKHGENEEGPIEVKGPQKEKPKPKPKGK